MIVFVGNKAIEVPNHVPPDQREQWARDFMSHGAKQPMRGLGDAVAAAIKTVSGGRVKPCEPCRKRQEALNRMVPFGNENPDENTQRPAGASPGEKSEEGTT